MKYPETKRVEVVDELHNTKISDYYRWLENYSDPEVQDWIKIQLTFTKEIMDKIPHKDEVQKRLEELLKQKMITVPVARGDKIFFRKQESENQPILYIKDIKTEKVEVLIDPNELSKEKPIAIDWYYPSPSGKFLIYGLSESGDEWSLLHIINIETKEILEDKIPRTRYSSICWLSDESGFYYTRYPEPGTVPAGQENYNRHVFFHTIGSDWHNDVKIFGEGRNPTEIYGLILSEDENYLQLNISYYTKNDLYLIDLKNNNSLIPIIVGEDCLTYAVFFENDLWMISNRNAPNRAIYKTSIANPTPNNWKLVIKEADNFIKEFLVTNEHLLLIYMQNAIDHLQIFTKSGKHIKEIEMPEMADLSGIAGNNYQYPARERKDCYFSYKSFFEPMVIYHYKVDNDKLEVFDEIESPANPSDYVAKQEWFKSKDGTKVSMFIIHKKGLVKDGSNPTILYGYGGFNIPIQPPVLDEARFFWMERGGIIVGVNLRGGSEYGENWHRGGMREKKQNVFDDFISAAKYLITEKYTSSDHLAIMGGSNGGLLTGAAVTQHPELFKAVYIGVPLLDMIRYHHFSIAKLWIPEYGSAEDFEQFKYLLKYSPYHNVRERINYPAIYLTTAESDSRVDPIHAMKMTALLQWANKSDEPIIFYIEKEAGHGIGKPLDKVIESSVKLFGFLGWKTGLLKE